MESKVLRKGHFLLIALGVLVSMYLLQALLQVYGTPFSALRLATG